MTTASETATAATSASDVVFAARGVGKRYAVRPERSFALGALRRAKGRSFWALRGLDLDVHAGEVVGVIGRNGAGKSTLLKLAAGVSTPTEGSLSRSEFIAPLIEVGAGFHPELTGRENLELNGQLLGLTRRQVRARFDEIVEFAEIAHAIDQPVKQYSSGMFMRLGFSIAVHTAPQLLVVDEVLAVGDLPFQTRCIERIEAMTAEGVGVLFVSHSLPAVQKVCTRAVLLDHGETIATGDPATVIAAYQQRIANESQGMAAEVVDFGATGDLQLVQIDVVDRAGAPAGAWASGDEVTVRLEVIAARDALPGRLALGLERDGAGLVSQWHSGDIEVPALLAGQRAHLETTFRLNVAGGTYHLTGSISAMDWSRSFLSLPRCIRFDVKSRDAAGGLVDVAPTFSRVQVHA